MRDNMFMAVLIQYQRVTVCMQTMAVVASLDLTSYLQAISPPAWIGHARYTERRCSLAHSRSSVDLLRTAAPVVDLTPSTCRDVRDDAHDFRSRDRAIAGATSDSATADSGFCSDSSEETNRASSPLSSSSSWPRRSNGKRVWFADDVGLDLVTVRRYDLPAASPTVADPVPIQHPACRRRRLRLEPGFRQPWLDPAGLRCRVDRDTVALESASSRGGEMSFAGTVLVANVAFEKRVTVRCTFDFWRSFVDVAAVYVTTGCPGTDLFAFEVEPDMKAVVAEHSAPQRNGGRFQFAIRYQYRAHSDAVWAEHWDNNDGRNYQMLATY